MLTWISILWAAVTLGFVVVMIWKALAGRKEEDVVILDPAEDGMAAEQQQTVAKVRRLTVWAKAFGFTSLGLLVLVGGISLFRALHAFSGGQ
ncbi:MAG: hypothetical protein ABSC23_00795 [Bryobacteraceae bacterium]|jgi:hypothetical protein